MCVSTADLGLCGHAGHCCGSQALQLGKTVGCFHPLEASAAPFGTMNASPQGENI